VVIQSVLQFSVVHIVVDYFGEVNKNAFPFHTLSDANMLKMERK